VLGEGTIPERTIDHYRVGFSHHIAHPAEVRSNVDDLQDGRCGEHNQALSASLRHLRNDVEDERIRRRPDEAARRPKLAHERAERGWNFELEKQMASDEDTIRRRERDEEDEHDGENTVAS